MILCCEDRWNPPRLRWPHLVGSGGLGFLLGFGLGEAVGLGSGVDDGAAEDEAVDDRGAESGVLRGAGSARVNASRTNRRCTPYFLANARTGKPSRHESRRICSNNSTFVGATGTPRTSQLSRLD
jgi:hypothetical protein